MSHVTQERLKSNPWELDAAGSMGRGTASNLRDGLQAMASNGLQRPPT